METKLESFVQDMRSWRHHFHEHPETAYEEHATADFIARLLQSWGIAIHRGLAGTGVVGTLRSGASTRSIGLRADMDALHVQELNGFGHRSRVEGKMHACGHDGHMAMLLGAAKYLSQSRRFDGTVHFVFQPAEENEAGARRMIEDGLFTLFPMDAIYGMHNYPLIDAGKFVVKDGPMMASADFFEVELTGHGAHGAYPHTGTDVIGVGAQIVSAFNHIVARTLDPLNPAVVSVTRFHAGDSLNVLPERARIEGTTRAFRALEQEHLERSMRQVSEAIGVAHGVRVAFSYERRYPATTNHGPQTRAAALAAQAVVGRENVFSNLPPVMGAEDFAWMLLSVPGSYVWLGNGPQHHPGCMLHNPRYDFNDDVLPIGASWWAELVEQNLAPAASERSSDRR